MKNTVKGSIGQKIKPRNPVAKELRKIRHQVVPSKKKQLLEKELDKEDGD